MADISLTVAEWALRIIHFCLNFYTIAVIYQSKESKKVHVYFVIYFLLINDIMGGCVEIFHDIPSYFQQESIFINEPFLYALATIAKSNQWFYSVLILPFFSIIHFLALFYPLIFRRISQRAVLILVIFIYFIIGLLTVPQLTPYMGFIYYGKLGFWSADTSKPYVGLQKVVDWWIQTFCLAVMFLANLLVICRLYSLRKKNVIGRQTPVVVISITLGEEVLEEHTIKTKRWKIVLSPEVRLGISFLLLSGCFFLSTLAYNFLLGTTNPILATLYLIALYLNRFKWIVYCLCNMVIRSWFISPMMVCGCL